MGKIGVPGGGSQTIKNGEKSALSCTVDRWGQIQLIVDGVDASLPNLFIGFSLYVNLFGVNSITIIVSMYSMTIHDDRYHSLLLNCCNIKNKIISFFFFDSIVAFMLHSRIDSFISCWKLSRILGGVSKGSFTHMCDVIDSGRNVRPVDFLQTSRSFESNKDFDRISIVIT